MFNFIRNLFKRNKKSTDNTVNTVKSTEPIMVKDNSYPRNRKELSVNPYAFKLSPVESWRYDNFVKRHLTHGQVTVSFKPIGIGIQVTCKCDKCNLVQDITEYESF